MHPAFSEYVQSLHSSFERPVTMSPVTVATVPKVCPSKCIYLFSDGQRPLYVGRTGNLRNRLRQHSIPGAQHNQAVFAFRLAREKTGLLAAAYTTNGSRAALCRDSAFAAAFAEAKGRIRSMELRYVEEPDPLRQALLEIYVAIVLETPYNDFDTH